MAVSPLKYIPLATFANDMRILTASLPRLLAEQDEAQAGIVAKMARARGAQLGSVHAHAAPGIKAVNQAPIVRLYGNQHPEIFGAEFGGGARPRTRQFPPWRGKGQDAGYMLFPVMREYTDSKPFYDAYFDTVKNALRFR